jgi:uncharacterized cupredoxin-like copper-binding protein
MIALLLAVSNVSALDQEESAKSTKQVDYSKAEELPFGKAVDPRSAKRVIHIEMSDSMRFSPAKIKVRKGESVRFEVTNKGKLKHEMVLGTMAELKEHGEMMKQFPDMEHDEPHMVYVNPGKAGEIGWQFTQSGDFYFACLQPGHFDAGMVGRIKVVAK